MAKRTHKRVSTSTSGFGTSGHIAHDASKFYAGKLYDGLTAEATPETTASEVPAESLNRILLKSSESMEELPDNSIHLMVTSPPYNVAKEYDDDLTLEEYRDLLRRVFKETFRVLQNGGRACVNIANLGRKPYIPLHSYIISDMQALGFQMRGEIIWDKGSSASPSTAWGSWQSASNPTLRDVHEYILVFSKGSYRRVKGGNQNTISRDEFLEFTKSVWSFPAQRATKVGHPAPFPLELPRRLIQLYTFGDDVVLDPFCGSGSTCLAAKLAGRKYIGYDIKPEYVELAEKRLETGGNNGARAGEKSKKITELPP